MFKLSFDTVQQLMDVKRELMPLIELNKKREKESSYQIIFHGNMSNIVLVASIRMIMIA